MKITMRELANQSGYSKATISRALSDDPRVKEETKQKIKALAEKYNYQPHTVASNLARRQTKIIGLSFPKAPRTVSDPFFLEFLNGVSDTLFTAGYSLLIPEDKEGEQTSRIEQLIHRHNVDGLILTEPRVNDRRVSLLKKAGVPFVFLGSTTNKDVAWVDGDNQRGAYLAVNYLLELGHRKIGIMTGEAGLVATRNRVAGYKLALHERGIELKNSWVIDSDFTQQGAYLSMGKYLTSIQRVPFTAMFASNDLMAIGAIRALKEYGYRIPVDLSVIGFDGIEIASYIEPPLATVEQPINQLGHVVARSLLGLIGGKVQKKPQICLPVRLIPRGSVCAIR